MSAPCSPRWAGPQGGARASYPAPGMRVSDADRTEVADTLSKHYGDGRLDEAEFGERLDRAMKAKTRADLNGLLDDLPGGGPPPATSTARGPARSGPPRRFQRFLLIALLVVAALAVWSSLTHWFVPWLLIGGLVFLWLRLGVGRRHRHY
jgi:Flp pilus assembly protein TadB